MSKKIARMLCLLLIASITASMLGINRVSSANPATIYVNPPSIIDPTMGPGIRFNITVYGTSFSDVYAWQVGVVYNPTLINCTNAWCTSDEMKLWGTSPSTSLIPGRVMAADTKRGSGSGWTGAGPIDLAIFEFEVTGRGLSVLNINNSYTYLVNSNLAKISGVTKTNGYFENVLPATMSVNPPKVVDPLLVKGTSFNVNVTITNATGVGSFEFTLGYNASILSVVSTSLGDFFPPVTPIVKINNTAGYVFFNASLTSPPPSSGTETLATITFQVEGLGVSILHLYDTQLADLARNVLPQTPSEDGYFNNILLTELYVDPPKIIDPLMKPPRIFSVNITINDVIDLYGYEFKLGYNTTMLTAIGVDINPIPSGCNFTTDWTVKNSIGQIWVNVTYYPPTTPITTYTPEALVTITFKVRAIGSSVLHLYDTKLWDSTGAPITHEAKDGFVMTLIRDVAIVNVVPSTSLAYAGALVNINVTAKNEGNNATETFDVKAYYDTNLIGTKTVTNLPPNAETTLTFTWNTTGVSDGIYTIKGNATFVPYEYNTTNNEYVDGTVQVVTQYKITFNQTGVGSDFTGTVLVIDGKYNYGVSALPVSLMLNIGSTHKFAFQSPLVVPPGGKEYDWKSTSGLSTLQSGSITVTAPGSVIGNYVGGVHDVAVTNVVADRTWVYQGLAANINVTVKNNGDYPETVNVTLYYNVTAGKIVGTQNITLLVGESKTLLFVWDTTGVPNCHNYTLTAVATIPADYKPADNTLDNVYIKVRIMGDINGDDTVDMLDIAIVARAFGSYPGHPRWNPQADLNGDGVVDMIDLAMVAINFGKTGSP
jgi:hypothetical protein